MGLGVSWRVLGVLGGGPWRGPREGPGGVPRVDAGSGMPGSEGPGSEDPGIRGSMIRGSEGRGSEGPGMAQREDSGESGPTASLEQFQLLARTFLADARRRAP